MKKRIAYFFIDGRSKRINSGNKYPEEMFYGFSYLKKKEGNVLLIEAKKTKIRKFFQDKIEDKISYILKTPLFFSYYLTLKNIYWVIKSNYLVLTNHRVAISCLPLIYISKIFFSKPDVAIFIMGMGSSNPKNSLFLKIKFLFVSSLFKNVEKVYFLSKAELDYYKTSFSKYSKKFHYYPFSVDLNFWKKNFKEKEKEILFVGNDGNRDYELLINIVNSLNEYKFTIVSNQITKDRITNRNCKIIQGSFASEGISDKELRDIYNNSYLTILPIRESIQPSGQSVALQSLACGTPVLITNTEGFWDKKNFKDESNIFFVNNNELDEWIKKINNLLSLDKEKYFNHIDKSLETITSSYDLDKFHKSFEKFFD